ncbi:MAG: ergothioneine biosynthesis glutamate--cysteine ligase EgtA [Frankia sp.]
MTRPQYEVPGHDTTGRASRNGISKSGIGGEGSGRRHSGGGADHPAAGADHPAATDPTIRDHRDIETFAQAQCLVPGPIGQVGIETEWLVIDPRHPDLRVPPDRTRSALGLVPPPGSGPTGVPVLPAGNRVTFEPGGQLELSGPPLPLADALRATAEDLADVRARLAGHGLLLAGLGADPLREPRRLLTEGRYAAMETYFASGRFPAGALMMCSTAALQVNLDAGPVAGWARRWWLAHALGPVLVAMFAASPVLAGRRTGAASMRQAVWAAIDPSRTAPVPSASAGPTEVPAEQWARYLANARLMLIREPGGSGPDAGSGSRWDETRHRAVLDGSTFADWVAGRGEAAADGRRPTMDDLAYHATTVFPVVRPRGWLELRYLDAQPPWSWPLAVIVATALLDDPIAAERAAQACAPVSGRWVDASERGLADPELRRAAITCVAAAIDACGRLGVPAGLVAALSAFAENSVDRGRCPGDELIDAFHKGGAVQMLVDATRWEADACVPAA